MMSPRQAKKLNLCSLLYLPASPSSDHDFQDVYFLLRTYLTVFIARFYFYNYFTLCCHYFIYGCFFFAINIDGTFIIIADENINAQ